MNARIKQVIFRIQDFLKTEISQNPNFSTLVKFEPRHAEHLAAAGFGYEDGYDYFEAAKAGIELCSGYYIPDSSMIRTRMLELGYPPALVDKCVGLFPPAASRDNHVRINMVDDLHDQSMGSYGSERSSNRQALVQDLEADILDEESNLWVTLAKYGVALDKSTDDIRVTSIGLPSNFPSIHHLGQTINAPFEVIYDLQQGENPEALFRGCNRKLGFRGNLRLKPSGKRGWAFPTIRLQETPFIDDRSADEKMGEYFTYQAPNIAEKQFDAGVHAGQVGMHPPPNASFDFLAGWIMDANDKNGTGHMSTGRFREAFTGALENAAALGTVDRSDALDLAAKACRYLASSRVHPGLEELIQGFTEK